MITVKRAYDPVSRADGARLLVERLWPRGIAKADAAVDEWLKDVAPKDLAGKNVLKTPMGRLPMPGAIVRMKGSMQSHQLSTMCSFSAVTVSTLVDRGSPRRENSASNTGSEVSANAGNSNVSMVRWSQRATATLSL